jgi:hypothetical protein
MRDCSLGKATGARYSSAKRVAHPHKSRNDEPVHRSVFSQNERYSFAEAKLFLVNQPSPF